MCQSRQARRRPAPEGRPQAAAAGLRLLANRRSTMRGFRPGLPVDARLGFICSGLARLFIALI
jgi:hypothetical protein